MTVETSTRKQIFVGGQSSLAFSFRTLVSNPEYIKVKTVEISSGEESDPLDYVTDYTVAINSDGAGGTVTIVGTPVTVAFNYVVYRETEAVQESDYDNFNQFPADTVENDLDRGMLIHQENIETVERTLRYPISASGASTELPAPVADAFLQWNADGTALENAVIPDPSTLVKASTGEAQAGVEDTHYMTPAKTAEAIAAQQAEIASQAQAEAASSNTVYMTPLRVKQEVEKASAVTIPAVNVPGSWPVGAIFFSAVSTNPATLLGFGTWALFGAGKMPVGVDSGDSDFDAAEKTGGAKTVALESQHNGPHTHTYQIGTDQEGGVGGYGNNSFNTSATTGSSGSGTAHQNMPPFIAVYMFKRTA